MVHTMKTRRALVIDDAKDMGELAKVFLELDGDYEVTVATSGADGVALARRDKPDVILLNYMMPGMDGPATLKELIADERTASIPVIFLAANAHLRVEQTLRKLGARDVIAKPFDPVSLAARVTAALDAG